MVRLADETLGLTMVANRTLSWHANAAALGSAASPTLAQTYPSKPIKLIVPFGAGGPVDVMGRLVAQKLSASVGAMIVENRPGQGGTLGSRAVAMADPDGYTLMMATSTTMGVSANLYKNLDFDPVKSFAPVALISSVPFVLVVRPSLPMKTAQEFVAYARANPGKLNFGFPTGTLPHLTGELFKLRTGSTSPSSPTRPRTHHHRPGLGPDRLHLRAGLGAARPHQRRHDAPARGDEPHPVAANPRRADARRERLQRLHLDLLERRRGAGPHARADRRKNSTPRSTPSSNPATCAKRSFASAPT